MTAENGRRLHTFPCTSRAAPCVVRAWDNPDRVRFKRFLPLIVGALGLATFSVRAAPKAATEDDALQLPDMQVTGGLSLKDFKMPAAKEVKAPEFSANDPFLKVQFPGQAVHDGIATGRATVGVMLDAEGKARDWLLIRYTEPYFGAALLDEARRRTYSGKLLHGRGIPAAFIFTYKFEPPQGLVGISNFEAASRRAEDVQGGAAVVYRPYQETEVEGGQLVPLRVAIPTVPAGTKTPARVLVTFYVDEQGRLRLPNVESDLAPELVPAVIGALQHWAFKPATVKGQPVLVRAIRALGFREAPAAAKKP